jgi:hypothetical protein
MFSPLFVALQVAAVQSLTSGSRASPAVFNGRAGELTVRAAAAAAAPAVDGQLDEPVWREASLLTGFSLYQPIDQRPAPDSTEVLVWYSPTAIYFGIRAFEPHGAVRATLADRDRISTDDNVEIHLDTYNERRRAFVFIVNPLGVQADGTKNESGGYIPGANVAPGQNDLSSDFVWESKGRLTEWGYEVEVRIPFSSLRYPQASEQRWGLQIDRRVQHSGYEETWTPARKASASFIAQAGYLTGLAGLHHGQVVQLNPEITNTVSGTACCTPAMREWRYDSDPQVGGNIRWGMGSNFVLNGTVKPDFSQVEADAAQIAADARFALFYPEKRPFFVEGAEQFNVPNTLVYTRRIVRPDGAAKFTGKIARTDIALLSAFDDPNTTIAGTRPLVDIVRLRRDFAQQSTAGVLYSERAGGGRENRVGGGDVKFVFGRMYYAQFQGVASTTRQAGTTRTGPMWEAVLDRTGRSWGFHYGIIGIDRDFQADNGFVPRTGYVQPSIANRYTWYGQQGSALERYLVFFQTAGLWRYDDFFSSKSMLENRLSTRNEFTFHGGWVAAVSPTLASYGFDRGAYAGTRMASASGAVPFTPSDRITTFVVSMSASTPQFRRFAASVGANVGNDVDFFETSRARRFDYNASLDLRPTSRLRITTTYVTNSFTRRRNDEQIASTRIPRLKVEYQVARPVFVRVVSQYEAVTRAELRDPRTGEVLLVSDNTGAFKPSTARASNALRTDWLFSYRPTPGTVFFLGYGGSLSEPDPLAFDRLRRTGDAFFVKASYVLNAR